MGALECPSGEVFISIGYISIYQLVRQLASTPKPTYGVNHEANSRDQVKRNLSKDQLSLACVLSALPTAIKTMGLK